jgi:hypothetical protein
VVIEIVHQELRQSLGDMTHLLILSSAKLAKKRVADYVIWGSSPSQPGIRELVKVVRMLDEP